MVWSASTLWAETADKGLASAWLKRLAENGIRPGRVSATRRPTRRSPSPVLDVSDPEASPSSDEGGQDSRPGGRRLRSLPRPSTSVTQAEILAKSLAERDAQISEKQENLLRSRRERFQLRRLLREQKTEAVKCRGKQLLDEKIDAAKELIRHNNRRFLTPIDRCETVEETNGLRKASFQTIIGVVAFVSNVRTMLARFRARMLLARYFIPLMFIRRQRKRSRALMYAGLWRGKIPRITVEQLQEWFPQLSSWTFDALQVVLSGMKRRAFAAGRILFHENEPYLHSFVITSGKVSMRQRMPNNQPDLLLGDRGAGYVYGDEQLFSNTPEPHSCKVLALENTYGWTIPKSAILDAARFNLTASRSFVAQDQSASAKVGGGCSSPSAAGPRALVKIDHLRANRCLAGWSVEDLDTLLEESTQRVYAKGETIYSAGEKGSVAFIVLKGTVELTLMLPQKDKKESVITPPAQNDGNGRKKIQAKADKSADRSTAANKSSQANNNAASLREAPPCGDSGLETSMSFAFGSTQGAGELSSFSFRQIPPADLHPSEKVVSYANAGKLFGESSVIFSFPREDSAAAATSTVLLEVPHSVLMSGMFSDPQHLCIIKQELNKSRALRLFPPLLAEISGHFVNQTFAPQFLRCMRPEVVSKGEMLPLRSCVVFLQSGKITMYGRTYASPCIVLSEDALEKTAAGIEVALENGTIVIQSLRTKTASSFTPLLQQQQQKKVPSPSPAILASVPNSPMNNAAGSQQSPLVVPEPMEVSVIHSVMSGVGDASFSPMAISDHRIGVTSPGLPGSTILLSGPFAAAHGRSALDQPIDLLDNVADELLDGLPVIHRALTRVDCWCVRYVDFLLRFRQGASKLEDFVGGVQLEQLKPPRQDPGV